MKELEQKIIIKFIRGLVSYVHIHTNYRGSCGLLMGLPGVPFDFSPD
jgi:hypothetical protein